MTIQVYVGTYAKYNNGSIGVSVETLKANLRRGV